jgi:hypothetical protein
MPQTQLKEVGEFGLIGIRLFADTATHLGIAPDVDPDIATAVVPGPHGIERVLPLRDYGLNRPGKEDEAHKVALYHLLGGPGRMVSKVALLLNVRTNLAKYDFSVVDYTGLLVAYTSIHSFSKEYHLTATLKFGMHGVSAIEHRLYWPIISFMQQRFFELTAGYPVRLPIEVAAA